MTDSLSSSTEKTNEKETANVSSSTTPDASSSATSTLALKAGTGLTSRHITRYLAEFCGTTLAVFITLASGALTTMTSDLTLSALAAFAGYAVVSYVFGRVSGGHFNPAVTLAAALTGRLDWLDALGYLIAQVLGGILAAFAISPVVSSMADWYLTRMQSSGQQSGSSAAKLKTNFWTSISNGYGSSDGHTMGTNLTGAVLLELVASLIVVMVAMRAIKRSGVTSKNSWLLTGASYAAGTFITVAFTGAALNPARATGASILAAMNGYKGALSQLWVFWVVPLLAGAIIGLILVIVESGHDSAAATSLKNAPIDSDDTADADPADSSEDSDDSAASDDSDSSDDSADSHPAEPVHKSDEQRDIDDFNTVIKQDTAASSREAADSDESMNIDFVDKKSSDHAE